MREIGFTSKVFSPDSIVGQLSGGERQGVALARAIYNKADLIVMDEPTTALSLTETEKVFRFVRAVRAGGRSVLFIGHNIHHVFDIAERFVVMDRGTVALQATKDEVGSAERLIAYMERLAHPQGDRDSGLARSPTGAGGMSASLEPMEARAQPVARPPDSALRRFADRNRAALGTFAVFVAMIAIFMAASPSVFLHWPIYNSVLVTLPVALCLVVPLVFVVTVGEIDLSFPATMGFSAWIFALVVHYGFSPYLGIVAALATGMALGAGVGALVVTAGLSSLVATLGMNFMLRGFIMIITQGKSIALLELQDTSAATLFSSQVFGFPVQVFWALAFVAFAGLLFNRHRFGARVRAVGDNPDSAGQMGINVARVRISTFVFMGLGAALAGVFSTMVNYTWWPTTGDGYLLPAIASVFVGGTPTWGGVGTITGGAIGALTVSFIQSGIVAAGLSGFYVQFFNGLIIILSLLGHRWNQKRYR